MKRFISILMFMLLPIATIAQFDLGGGPDTGGDEEETSYFKEPYKIGVSVSMFQDKDFKGYPIHISGLYQIPSLPVFVYLSGDIINGTTIKNNYDNSGMKANIGGIFRINLLEDESMNLDFRLGYSYINFKFLFPSSFELKKSYHAINGGVDFHWYTIRNNEGWLFPDTRITIDASFPPPFINNGKKLAVVDDNYPAIDYTALYSFAKINWHQAWIDLPFNPLVAIGSDLGIIYYNQMNQFNADYNVGAFLSFFENKTEFWGVSYNYYSRAKMTPAQLYRHEVKFYLFIDWFIKNHVSQVNTD
ncbi:MAG: hypothetical protein V1865_01160 [bacterium]